MHNKMEEAKRKLIRSLEDARREQAASTDRGHGSQADFDGDTEKQAPEVINLRKELLSSRKTCHLLQQELERLERRALTAIAEAAEWRRRLEERDQGSDRGGGDDTQATWQRERERLTAELRRISTEKELLLGALSTSEREIGRLTRALELVVSRVRVA